MNKKQRNRKTVTQNKRNRMVNRRYILQFTHYLNYLSKVKTANSSELDTEVKRKCKIRNENRNEQII